MLGSRLIFSDKQLLRCLLGLFSGWLCVIVDLTGVNGAHIMLRIISVNKLHVRYDAIYASW